MSKSNIADMVNIPLPLEPNEIKTIKMMLNHLSDIIDNGNSDLIRKQWLLIAEQCLYYRDNYSIDPFSVIDSTMDIHAKEGTSVIYIGPENDKLDFGKSYTVQ